MRQGRGGIKHLVDSAGSHCASHRKGDCAEPTGPYIRGATLGMSGAKVNKSLNNSKCLQQFSHPNVQRLNVALCVYGEKYFTCPSKCWRLQLKAMHFLPSNTNHEHGKSHYVFLQAII